MGGLLFRCASLRSRSEKLPSSYALSALFAGLSREDAAEFSMLIACPSNSGVHLLWADDKTPILRVKNRLTNSVQAPRYDIYEVLQNGWSSPVAMGTMEKVSTTWMSRKGAFRSVQAWHVSVCHLEKRSRKGVLHPETNKLVPTPTESWGVNMHIVMSGTRDFRRGHETWKQSLSTSDPVFTLRVEGAAHRTVHSIRVLHVFCGSELVLIATRQGFEARRGTRSRPFVGLQFKGGESKLKRRAGKTPAGAGPGTLPLFLALAWCEDALAISLDDREEHVRGMRDRNNTDEIWEGPSSDPHAAPPVPLQPQGFGRLDVETLLNPPLRPTLSETESRSLTRSLSFWRSPSSLMKHRSTSRPSERFLTPNTAVVLFGAQSRQASVAESEDVPSSLLRDSEGSVDSLDSDPSEETAEPEVQSPLKSQRTQLLGNLKKDSGQGLGLEEEA